MSNVIGIDIGTMFLCSARQKGKEQVEIRTMRNMYVDADPNVVEISELTDVGWDYIEIKDEDGITESIIVIGGLAMEKQKYFSLKEAREEVNKICEKLKEEHNEFLKR